MTGPDGGTRHDYEHRGILPRVLSEVFEAVSLIPEDAKIRLSYVEIYNEQLVDLLSDPRGLGGGSCRPSSFSFCCSCRCCCCRFCW